MLRVSKLAARELAIIGRRIIGGLFVEAPRGCRGTVGGGGPGGPALPVSGPGPRHRRFRELGDSIEMHRRAHRVVQEAERDPAGVEFRLDLHLMRHRGMFGAKLVGGRRVVLIEEFAGEQPAFDPPCVAVDEKRGVARRSEQDIGCRADFLGMPQFVDLREQKAGVLPKGRGHLGKKLVARRFFDDCGACLGERQYVRPGQSGGAECRGCLILVEKVDRPGIYGRLSRDSCRNQL